MKTKQFDYDLPRELIAQSPLNGRDRSKMMILDRKNKRCRDATFTDLIEHLDPGDRLVINETKVVNARLFGKKNASGGKVELLFVEEIEADTWHVFMKASRRPKVGDQIVAADGQAMITVLRDDRGGRADVRIESDGSVAELLRDYGETPLPPYIKRNEASDETRSEDLERYQTIFARHEGAVAAPTAGLHFTPSIIRQLDEKGVGISRLVLHVGPGTFLPVTAEDIEDHQLLAERYVVSESTADEINTTRKNGGRIVAVGSTSVRTLETLADDEGSIGSGVGKTDLFIHPPFSFKAVDA
ncbi:MAG: tRNA preQ1(34) S-adenosylmethionine ribosyltransferase-isomerase QueA, partial [Verrucomicrobiota bacterium]